MVIAIVATKQGGPDGLAVVESQVGEPGPAEVRLAVRSAGVNQADYKSYSGAMGPRDFPLSLGSEAAGVVIAVGSQAQGAQGAIAVGDEVIVFPAAGAYAEEIVVQGNSLVPKPRSLDWAAAAGLMLTGTTAAHLVAATGVGAGDTVLVHGAAGGVGFIAVQLIALRGARAIATSSPERFDILRSLGAIPVAYGDGLLQRVKELMPAGVDAVMDIAGTDEALDASLALVDDRQRIATIVDFGSRARASGIQLLGFEEGADPGTEIRMAARTELAELAGSGALRVIVGQTYPLTEAAAAHRDLQGHKVVGKAVLVMAPRP